MSRARLTALRLVGFKSFAERTTVEFGLARTKRWLRGVAEPELAAQGTVDDLKPSKSVLQERAYAMTGRAPHYELVSDEGPPHARHYIVEVRVGGKAMGRGEGRSRRDAETEAASLALVALDSEQKKTGGRK